MTTYLNLAMVGCGDIAGAYLESVKHSTRCRFIIAMDINRAMAEQRAGEHGLEATDSFDAVLTDARIDAVVISVPHYLHAPMTIKALRAGKHVMCDKPIATTVADADRMIATAAETGRKLTVNYPMRFSGKARFARALIREGVLGDIFAITIMNVGAKPAEYWSQGWNKVTRTDWRGSKAKSGGGATLMNSSHHIDLTLHVTGLHAVDGSGMAGTFNSPPGIEVEDLSTGILRLNNGGIMTVATSSCYPGGLPIVTSIAGTNGQIDLQGGDRDHLRIFLNESRGVEIKSGEWVNIPTQTPKIGGTYTLFLDQFAEAVQQGAPVPVKPEDARHTLACVLAIYGEVSAIPPGYSA